MISEETRLKMSLAHKGKIKTAEHLKNISKALTGKKLSEAHCINISAAQKGKIISDETKRKISLGCTGRHWKLSTEAKHNISVAQKKRFQIQPVWNKGKEYFAIKGDKNPNWKGGITKQDNILRKKFRSTILKEVFARDNYTCQKCKIRGVHLHCDHIEEWSSNPEKRFEITNCITLCMQCHYQKTFGYPMPKDIVWGHNVNHKIKYK